MTVYEIIGSILLIVTCILVIITVLLQNSKADGISALGGNGYSGSKAEAKSNDAKLCKVTKVLAVVFFAVTLGVYACTIYLS